MKIILLPACALLLTLTTSLSAQVKFQFYKNDEINSIGFFKTESLLKKKMLPSLNKDSLLNLEDKNPLDKTLKFACAIPVTIDVARSISWTTKKGNLIGRYMITCQNANTISAFFDQFYMPNGTVMYIYDENTDFALGPITENENNKKRVWGTMVFLGSSMVIEISIPINELKNLKLKTKSIAYGYKDIKSTDMSDKNVSKDLTINGFGNSGSCNINVLCSLGTGWETERNSVGVVLTDLGQRFGSCVVINNTCQDRRPFVLTAHHVISGAFTDQTRFMFNYWSPTCSPSSDGNTGLLYNDYTLRGTWDISDFTLAELNQPISVGSSITFSGWSRNTSPASSSTGIHHPSGDVMKISRDDDAPIYRSLPRKWEVSWNQGVTEPGSSGSPLYDQNHFIIGQLWGGASSCSDPSGYDLYGAVHDSWDGGGTSSTRLKDWLDPLNTNQMTLDAMPVNTYQIDGNDIVCTSNNYSVINLPNNANVTWNLTPSGIATITPGSNGTVTVNRIGNNNGTIGLTATISRPCNTNILSSKSIVVGNPYTAWPYVRGPEPTNCLEKNRPILYGANAFPEGSELLWGYVEGPYTSPVTFLQPNGIDQMTITVPNYYQYNAIYLAVVNECGTGTPAIQIFEFSDDCGDNQDWRPKKEKTPIAEISNNKFSLSPNPTTNSITVTIPNAYLMNSMRIIDVSGRTIKTILTLKSTQIIDVSSLKNGLYVLQLMGKSGSQNIKFIKH